jgi:hypothetical protein
MSEGAVVFAELDDLERKLQGMTVSQ